MIDQPSCASFSINGFETFLLPSGKTRSSGGETERRCLEIMGGIWLLRSEGKSWA
jgi:hypothetical protein